MEKQFLDVPELEELTGIGRDKWYEFFASGECEAHDVSRRRGERPRWIVSREALTRFLRSRSNQANRTPEPTPRHRRAASAAVPSYV